MSERTDNHAVRREMSDLLNSAFEHVRHAGIRSAFCNAAGHAARAAAWVAVGYIGVRLVARLLAVSFPPDRLLFPAAIAIGALAGAAAVLRRELRRRPTLAEAAERLDLSVNDHNRIAIALNLASRDVSSPFIDAAIQDGLEHLRRLKDRPPTIQETPVPWPTLGRYGLVVVAGSVLAALIGNAPSTRPPNAARPIAMSPPPSRPPAQSLEERRTLDSRPALETQPAVASGKRSENAPQATRPVVGSRHEPAIGRASGHAGGESASPGQAAGARGEPTEASASAKSGERKPPAPKPSRPSRETPVVGGPKPEKSEESSAIGQGTSGGGAMSVVRHSWSQREQTAEIEREQDETDEQTENETESNTQRGGVQPSLKDRNEAPSRDLGISGDEGPPGTGRGGPSPPKKSRGTASLVLGVPVPDFVRGRLGPGLTKVTQERVEPSPMPGEPGRAAFAASRSSPEPASSPSEIPPTWTAVVRGYLIALHSADKNRRPEGVSTPAAPSDNKRSVTGP